MVSKKLDIKNLVDVDYVPSSVERKKSVLMYFFVWILLVLLKDTASIYEYYHLKQALWRRMLFFLTLICTIIFVFIPYLWIIPVFFFFLYVVLWIIFVKQAWEWRYTIYENKIFMPLFHWLWSWVTHIFEITITKQ